MRANRTRSSGCGAQERGRDREGAFAFAMRRSTLVDGLDAHDSLPGVHLVGGVDGLRRSVVQNRAERESA